MIQSIKNSLLKLKIKKGDTVKVISGANKGAQGIVLGVKPSLISPKILIEGVNLKKHYQKKNEKTSGGIIEKEAYLAYSNVVLIEKKS